jgi:transcriptional regulator with XRE-family HTH domain
MVPVVPIPDQTLAGVLRHLRQERGITQETLAFNSHVTVSALSRIERGRSNPVWTTLVQIAEALDITPAELIAIAEDARTRERAAMN